MSKGQGKRISKGSNSCWRLEGLLNPGTRILAKQPKVAQEWSIVPINHGDVGFIEKN